MPRPRTDSNPPTPQVLEKALRVLGAFDTQSPEWSEADLRRHLGMPSTTLNRIIRTFESAGYLLRDEGGRYRLGVAAIRLGRRASASINLPTALDKQLRSLARATDELVILALPELETGRARYAGLIESSKRVRVTADPGTTVPLTSGATARALLAFQPQPEIDAILRRPRDPLGAGTILDREAILTALDTTRAQGWARSWEETYDGAWAIAVPLLDDTGQAFASIGIATPTSRHTPELEVQIRELLTSSAEQATAALHTNAAPPPNGDGAE